MLTRAIFIAMIVYPNTLIAITIPTTIAAASGTFYLYMFSSEFKIAQVIKMNKIKSEEKLLNKFIFMGKFLSTLIVGLIGGPLFAALTIDILLPKFRYKYLYVIFVSATSILISLCLARGIFKQIYWLTTR